MQNNNSIMNLNGQIYQGYIVKDTGEYKLWYSVMQIILTSPALQLSIAVQLSSELDF